MWRVHSVRPRVMEGNPYHMPGMDSGGGRTDKTPFVPLFELYEQFSEDFVTFHKFFFYLIESPLNGGGVTDRHRKTMK